MDENRRNSRFFVMHLSESDLVERGLRSTDKPFEIQLLNSEGRAKACGYVGTDETTLNVDGYTIPFAVIAAAYRQTSGQGDYVDEHGSSVRPF